MLGVLGTIVKIILLILAGLLALLILLILLLLLVPVRYRFQGEKQEEINLKGYIRYLFPLLSVPISLKEGTLWIRVRLLWITLYDSLAPAKEKRRAKDKDKKKNKKNKKPSGQENEQPSGQKDSKPVEQETNPKAKVPAKLQAENTGIEESKKQVLIEGLEKPEEKALTAEPEEEPLSIEEIVDAIEAQIDAGFDDEVRDDEAGDDEARDDEAEDKKSDNEKPDNRGLDGAQPPALASEQDEEQEKRDHTGGFFAAVGGFFRRIGEILKKLGGIPGRLLSLMQGIKSALRGVLDKIKNIKDKISLIRSILNDPHTKPALKHILAEVGYLLRRLLPRKLQGEVHYGFDDPATTGEVTGVLGVLYPAYQDKLKLQPDFEQAVLEGELDIKGRLRLLTVVQIVWRLYRDKDLMYVYQTWLKK